MVIQYLILRALCICIWGGGAGVKYLSPGEGSLKLIENKIPEEYLD
jgi:hypothetical protein